MKSGHLPEHGQLLPHQRGQAGSEGRVVCSLLQKWIQQINKQNKREQTTTQIKNPGILLTWPAISLTADLSCSSNIPSLCSSSLASPSLSLVSSPSVLELFFSLRSTLATASLLFLTAALDLLNCLVCSWE